MTFVSIVLPCRNEKEFIGNCLESIIAQDYPKDRLEVLVVDGMSEDGTRGIIEEFASRSPSVKLVENPKRITSCAFNAGIKNACGEIIVIMGAHSTYKEDYISKCVRYLDEYKADNVGGVLITRQRNEAFIGRCIIRALSSPFGVGNSIFRTGSKEPRWVDTVFGGCYRKEVFGRIGLFNENLVFSSDMEFNLRLKRAGGMILLHPEIVTYYYTRSEFKDFCRSNLKNGFWAVYPMKFVRNIPVSLRHLIPLFFVCSLILLLSASRFIPFLIWFFLGIIGSYAVACLYSSAAISVRERNIFYLFAMPVVFTALHFLYGLGSFWALLRLFPLRRKEISKGME